eukprot:353445-Chlamydomonas_euryale.AAC.23
MHPLIHQGVAMAVQGLRSSLHCSHYANAHKNVDFTSQVLQFRAPVADFPSRQHNSLGSGRTWSWSSPFCKQSTECAPPPSP